jgi:dihydroorotase
MRRRSRGLVQAIETGPGRLDGAGGEVIEAEGLIVTPGLIDVHVHFRDPHPDHEETIASGAEAAVAGGFTTVCCMPNTSPPLDSPDLVELVEHRAREAGAARVLPVGAATADRAGEHLAPILAMAAAGAVAFSDDGDCVADASVMLKVLQTVRETGRPFMQHCQEPSLTRGASMNAGPLAAKLGLIGWPAVAEEMIIERDVRLNGSVGARYHAQHVSAAGSVEIIRRARAAGQPVSGEASPHHLLLTDDACAGYDAMFKMNPPLRTRGDVDALIGGVADGTIDVLATDHAPHPLESKRAEFASASFGIVGLESALPLYIRALLDPGVVDWSRLVAMMTINPARLAGLDQAGLGRLAASAPADLTIIDPTAEWTIDASEFRSRGRNCPFHGWAVRGRAAATIVGGLVRMRRADLLGERVRAS